MFNSVGYMVMHLTVCLCFLFYLLGWLLVCRVVVVVDWDFGVRLVIAG